MNEHNSYLIPVEELVEAGVEDGHLWAKCSLKDLKTAMRFVFENREEAKRVGRQARRDIVSQFSEENIAEIVVGKVQDIVENLSELIQSKQKRKQEMEQRRKEEEEIKKDKVAIKIIDDLK